MNRKTFIIGVAAICVSIIIATLIMKPQAPLERYTIVTAGNRILVIDNETNEIYETSKRRHEKRHFE